MNTWVLSYPVRPWTVNSERGRAGKAGQGTSGHWSKRAGLVREWRDAFCTLAQEAGVPDLVVTHVVVEQFCPDARMPDTGACYPAVKAAIDGLVDAGVVNDDKGADVPTIVMTAPQKDKSIGNLLRLTLFETREDVGRWLSDSVEGVDHLLVA